tara:strand:+ start:142 stop:642 length:501 start_codon:yes stop_codon:yes gene_type:complete
MYNLIRFLLPFSNEIGNVLTISGTGPFKRLYKPCPHSWTELSTKTIIDVCALCGIVWNVSYTSNKYGYVKGVLHGCILIIIAFIIPNLSMEYLINTICKESTDFDYMYIKENEGDIESVCGHTKKLIIGILYICVLLVLESLLTIITKGKVNKYLRNSMLNIFYNK